MSSAYPPSHAQVLIIGGGPSGSYAAAALAREGLDVVLLESATFPRYHIGESLIPSVRHHLKFIDAEHKVASHGFARKPGAAIKFNQYKKEGYTDFIALGLDNSSWNVNRSEFDTILLEHAQSCGTAVFQSTKVLSVEFSADKPIAATWSYTPTSSSSPPARTDTITFDYVIDASGRAGILSTRYLRNRHFNAGLKNVAMWGYWRGGGVYAEGTTAEGAPWFEALTDETGWAWFIPLRDGLTSVGVVRDQRAFSSRMSADSPISPSSPSFWSASPSTSTSLSSLRPSTPPSSPPTPFSPGGSLPMPSNSSSGALMGRYMGALDLAPGVRALLGEGGMLLRGQVGDEVLNEDNPGVDGGIPRTPMSRGRKTSHPGPGVTQTPGAGLDGVGIGTGTETVRTASDYSYQASTYAGEGFRIVGDAGAFIDPFFSSGVHLAMTSGLAAAASIAAAIRGDCTEKEAAEWHSQRVGVSYTRFLVVVLSAYKQMRAQSTNVLCDIGEDNFDKAFAFLRPVIQGNADLGPRLSEIEVQSALDFCTDLFRPLDPGAAEVVRKRVEGLDLQTRPDSRPLSAGEGESPARVVLQEPMSPTRQGRPPRRKRSGTIDTVLKWIGKVRGDSEGDDVEDSTSPSITLGSVASREPSRRRGTISGGGMPHSILKQPAPVESPRAPSSRPSHDIFDVGGPLLAPAAIDAIVQRAHPIRPSMTPLRIDTAAPGLLPAPDISAPHSGRDIDAEETRAVLAKINARRVIHREHGGLHSLEEEALGAGFTVRLERGRLGLVRAVEGTESE